MKVPTEAEIERWLENDISRVGSDLLVIGRQVRTDFDGFIDLLCIDKDGRTVVIELKKGRTPRDVTAQALDYASWVKGLSSDRLTTIAERYLSSRTRSQESLRAAFKKRFRKELPGTLNRQHRAIILVGVMDAGKEAVDPGTARIVNYLDELGVPISYQPVHYTENEDGPLAAIGGAVRAIYGRIRGGVGEILRVRRYKTVDMLASMADANGIGSLYGQVRKGVQGILTAQPYNRTVGYRAKRPAADGGGVRTVLFIGVYPADGGGLGFTLHATRFRTILGIEPRVLRKCLPAGTRDVDVSKWVGASEQERRHGRGLEGEFQSSGEVAKFIDLLRNRTSTDFS